MKTTLTLLALGCTFLGTSCQNYGPNANRGAATGALIGAGAGAIIGNQSGRALEGAAIGAAGGAVVGGAYGNAQDQEYRGY
ncbi:glycine zipper domain-containing protein [Luteolibacter marinus]|uniref:glycine zipper domain-containing protein n=1 Tax=Luteolibacter marinus TaxID=2776705 RepID=UPI0018675528|nr:glycine zipper domain-containing protein [Luteolibacter marinus]